MVKPTSKLSLWQEYAAGPAKFFVADAVDFSKGVVVDTSKAFFYFPGQVLYRTLGATDAMERDLALWKQEGDTWN